MPISDHRTLRQVWPGQGLRLGWQPGVLVHLVFRGPLVCVPRALPRNYCFLPARAFSLSTEREAVWAL